MTPTQRPIETLEAGDLIAILENDTEALPYADTYEIPAALERLQELAARQAFDATADDLDEQMAQQRVAQNYLDERALRAGARVDLDGAPAPDDVAALEALERLTSQDEAGAPDEHPDTTEPPPIRNATRLAGVGLALATYHHRRRRLAALEVRDTQAARTAKLELELGEARDALEAIEQALEGPA